MSAPAQTASVVGRLAASLRQHLVGHPRILGAVARLVGPSVAADLAASYISDEGGGAGPPVVLCIERLLFDKDIAELRRRGSVRYLTVSSAIVGRLQAAWVPKEMRQQTYHLTYGGGRYDRARRLTDRFALDFVRLAVRRHDVGAIMSANIDYWQDESLRRACGRLGVPFLVLLKENHTIPGSLATTVARHRRAGLRFSGPVAVFGERTREVLEASGACPPDRVWLTGAPRLAPWHDMELPAPARRDAVVLLSYASPRYRSPETFRAAAAELVEASPALVARGLEPIIKCKNAEDAANVERLLAAIAPAGHAVTVKVTEPLPPLLARARLVLGFNSLALLESLLTRAVIAVPAWGDAVWPRDRLMIDTTDLEARRLFRILEESNGWRELLRRAEGDADTAAIDDELGRARRRFLRRFFHVPEESDSVALVDAFVRHHVGPSRAGADDGCGRPR